MTDRQPARKTESPTPVGQPRPRAFEPAVAQAAHVPLEAALCTPAGIILLQRSIGNAAVTRLLAARVRTVSPSSAPNGEPTKTPLDVQRALDENAPFSRSAADVSTAIRASSGAPMDTDLQAEMEARMGQPAGSFDAVRIDGGPEAMATARALQAHAFTAGDKILGDVSNKRILAHELTHVIQQRQGAVEGADNGFGLKVSDPSDRFEREAEADACRAWANSPAPLREHKAAITGVAEQPTIQRVIRIRGGHIYNADTAPESFEGLWKKGLERLEKRRSAGAVKLKEDIRSDLEAVKGRIIATLKLMAAADRTLNFDDSGYLLVEADGYVAPSDRPPMPRAKYSHYDPAAGLERQYARLPDSGIFIWPKSPVAEISSTTTTASPYPEMEKAESSTRRLDVVDLMRKAKERIDEPGGRITTTTTTTTSTSHGLPTPGKRRKIASEGLADELLGRLFPVGIDDLAAAGLVSNAKERIDEPGEGITTTTTTTTSTSHGLPTPGKRRKIVSEGSGDEPFGLLSPVGIDDLGAAGLVSNAEERIDEPEEGITSTTTTTSTSDSAQGGDENEKEPKARKRKRRSGGRGGKTGGGRTSRSNKGKLENKKARLAESEEPEDSIEQEGEAAEGHMKKHEGQHGPVAALQSRVRLRVSQGDPRYGKGQKGPKSPRHERAGISRISYQPKVAGSGSEKSDGNEGRRQTADSSTVAPNFIVRAGYGDFLQGGSGIKNTDTYKGLIQEFVDAGHTEIELAKLLFDAMTHPNADVLSGYSGGPRVCATKILFAIQFSERRRAAANPLIALAALNHFIREYDAGVHLTLWETLRTSTAFAKPKGGARDSQFHRDPKRMDNDLKERVENEFLCILNLLNDNNIYPQDEEEFLDECANLAAYLKDVSDNTLEYKVAHQ